MRFKTSTKLLTAALALATVAPFVQADPPAAPPKLNQPNQVTGNEINAAQRAAVESGLAYLAKKQAKNGAFGADGAYGGGQGGHVGISALAGVAFMAAGNLPGRGKYGDNVNKDLDFILSCCNENGFISPPAGGEMYSHGFATLFLGEVYGMAGGDDDVRMATVKEKLKKAVRLIQGCQSTQAGSAGGWRYQPAPVDADISITICQIMALRAARDGGIKVEKDVIDNAVKYVHTCQSGDGGFSYTAGGGGSGFARSAAGVAALYYAGEFQDKGLEKGLGYLKQYIPGKGGRGGDQEGHYFYGNYYATQAMFLAGGEYWSAWYPAIRDQLIARQNKTNGNWSGEAGDDYCTAMALIILQMPNRYLPVFHGKGQGS